MRHLFCALLLVLATALPALATEYWSGYDSAGNRVEIIVRHAESLRSGSDVFVRDVGRSTQAEGTVTDVSFEDSRHARVAVNVNGYSLTCEVSR